MKSMGQLLRPTEPRWFDSSSGRTGRFDAVAVAGGKPVPVVGMRLAREGLAFVSGVALRDPEVPVSFTIRRRTIPSRVRIVKYEPLREATRIVHRYYCSFTSLEEADRDAVVRYVDGLPEPAEATAPAGMGSALSAHAQARIAERLVSLKRLAPTAPGLAPLIRLEAQPIRKLEDGREFRDVVVHSRIRTSDGIRSYITRFRVFADDQVDALL